MGHQFVLMYAKPFLRSNRAAPHLRAKRNDDVRSVSLSEPNYCKPFYVSAKHSRAGKQHMMQKGGQAANAFLCGAAETAAG